ncbi:MAG: hypothetical protein ACFNX0_04205 [Treponema sp.]
MKYLISSLAAAALLVSCASVPQKEFDDATALRKRASRYEQVKTYENESFNVAEENYTKADDIIKEKRKKEWPDAKTALLTASENYQKVIDNGMPAYASDLRTDIDKTVKEADSLKAQVALKEKYQAASELYNEAVSTVSESDYDNGLEKLENVKKEFDSIYEEVKVKHDESLKSVEELRIRLKKLEDMAKEIENMRGSKK